MKVERVQPEVIAVKIEMSLEEWRLLRKLLVANITVPRALQEGGWIEVFEQEAVTDILDNIRKGVEE